MSKPLVVVDSEAKSRSLRDQYDVDVDTLVLTSAPLRVSCKKQSNDLSQRQMVFEFAPLAAEKARLAPLTLDNRREVYLALNSDLQGEYLSWMLSEYLAAESKGALSPKHITLAGLGRDELVESFRLVKPVLADSASTYFVRSIFDGCLQRQLMRLIGTRVGPGGVPLTLASLTVLFLLTERNLEINTYAPSLKWQVSVKMTAPAGEVAARLEESFGVSADGFFKDSQAAIAAIASFKDTELTVRKITRTPLPISAPVPYRLSELLTDAYLLHNIGPKKLMESVRRLFDGCEVNGSHTGLISAAGINNDAIIDGLVKKIRSQVEAEFGADMLSGDEVDAADEYIYPLRPEILANDLDTDPDLAQVYELIRRRALASQMMAAAGETLKVELQAGETSRFAAVGRVINSAGFLDCYQARQHKDILVASPLADLKEGMKLAVSQIVPEHAGDFAPEYYTIDSLYGDLADFSIALDIVNAGTLQSLLDSGYIKIDTEGGIECLDNVGQVVSVLNRALPTMPGINLSAYLEQTIAEVMSGRKPLDFALQQFDQTLFIHGKVLVKVKVVANLAARKKRSTKIIKISAPQEPTVKKEEAKASGEAPAPGIAEPLEVAAPDQQELVDNDGVEYIADDEITSPGAEAAEVAEIVESAPVAAEDTVVAAAEIIAPEVEDEWPEEVKEMFSQSQENEEKEAPAVQAEISVPVEATAKTQECTVCGRPMLLKKDRYGRYWACSGFPGCRHSESFEQDDAWSMDCPICQQGKVISKITPTGKPFYICPEQDCEFMAWTRPHSSACPVCGSPFLVEKKSLGGKKLLRCPRAGCVYMEPMVGGEEPAPGKKKVRVRRVVKKVGVGGKKRRVRLVRRKK